MTVYDISATTIAGERRSLADYRGRVLLIVNVASKCGFTPQYAGLQELYRRYAAQGFEVLAFPCDQFGHQEPGDDAAIRGFCETRYQVSFPVFSKIEVNGPHTHPLYRYLKQQKGGLLSNAIKWNFTKFLVARSGTVLARFAPTKTPAALAPAIEAALASPRPVAWPAITLAVPEGAAPL